MRNITKKPLSYKIQKGSHIGTILCSLGMGVGAFLYRIDATPLIVSSATLLASLMTFIGSGTVYHVKKIRERNCEDFYNSIKVIEVIPKEDEKQGASHFYAVEKAYEKKDNMLSVDFEKISNLKRGKSLTFKNNIK